ncbi:MAG: sensor domain-containing diguanylate cyclase [Ectothiorhodospiraceae bacterium]|nr:sensor domain-containing diguanylate cyclase [Ectothiorhodospiraceae bacterium]MCH8505476.1 diguanylate cyclase [Ectothiorhodospiraceae bacterium]
MTRENEQRALLEAVFERINVGVLLLDDANRIVRWNRFMATHSGLEADAVLGRDLFDCFPELPASWLKRKLESVRLLRNYAFTSWEQRPYLFRFQHDRPVTGGVDWMRQDCTLIPISDSTGQVSHVCITVVDVTDASLYQSALQEANTRLEEASVRDGLTGIYNRGHLETRLAEEFARVRRHGGALSVVMFDFDNFKRVNDTHGHQCGDEVLRQVIRRTSSLLRAEDLCGRYGGEEFTLLLPDTPVEQAVRVAERVRAAVEATPIRTRNRELGMTITLGIAGYEENLGSHEQLLDNADKALYRGKREGRNRIALFDHRLDGQG